MSAARSLLIVTAGLLAGCSSSTSSSRPRRPGDEVLKSIKFEGNKQIGQSTLVTGLALHRTQARGRAPDPYLISVDAERIKGEYLRRGFLDVDVRSRTVRQGDETTVIYTVEEGVRATTRVVITGLPDDPDISPDKVRAVLGIKDGDPFNYATYELAKDPLKNVVEDAGYAHVKLDAQVVADRANHTAVIELSYSPGPKCVFGKVDITGATGKLRSAIANRVQLVAGQQYSTAAIAATQQQLYALGRFSTVRVQPSKEGGNSIIDVKVDVAESSKHEVKLGVGAGMDPASYEVRGRVGYTIIGWPFQMHTFSLDLRPAYARLRDTGEYEPRIRAMAKDVRQDLFWTYAQGIVEGGYNYLAVEAYTSYGPRAKLGFETPIKTEKLKLRVGWSLERLDFRRISPLIDMDLQARLGLDHTEQVGAYEQSLIVDLRNHPTETRSGVYGEVRVAEGTVAAGGQYNYVQLVPELRGYVPLGPVVFAGRGRWGRFFGKDVPATERFFSGGSVSQRGFSERRLAPQVRGDVMGTTQDVPYGGTTMFETGVETRFPITTLKGMPLGGVVFLDGADVVEEPARLQLSNLHWALGFGLRLHTIVGPLRFDFGYRLNRTGAGEPSPSDKFAFHLSLGEAF
jgi:translocation and assembly module TamA